MSNAQLNARQRILVVEDEQHLAFIIKYNLEAEGYDVTVEGEGPAALQRLRDESAPFDLLILDLMLPGMSGYSVCQTLRDEGNQLPILMVSARTLAEDRIRGYEVGTDQYLQKPFELDELLAMVRNLLARHQRRGASSSAFNNKGLSTYDFGRAHVNFETFEVSVAGESVKLTSTEMKLLRFFIEHEGVVVSRETLLEEVWELRGSPTTRTVDNFIVRLRKTFEVDPANPRHFLSVRGAGYRFVAEPDDTTATNDESVAP